MITSQSFSVVLGTVAAAGAPPGGSTALAGSATVNRYIRSIHVVNVTASAATVNIGVGVSATLTAANANIAFGLSIPANSDTPVYYPGGKGFRANAASSANTIMAFAGTGSALTLVVVYDEDSLTV